MSAQTPTPAMAAQTQMPESEVLRLLHTRGSVRKYTNDPIPQSWVESMLAAVQHAPTSNNIQAYSIVVVRNQDTKEELARLAGNQQHIIDCPVFFAICADLSRPALACEMHGTTLANHTTEQYLVATVDAALVGMSLELAGDSLGLGSVMIGGMRNHPLEVAKLLNLPPRCYVVFGMCMGFPQSAPPSKPRQPMGAVVHYEKYDTDVHSRELAAYDSQLAEHYGAQGRETPEQSWTKVTAEKFSQPARPNLRAQLKTLGFPME